MTERAARRFAERVHAGGTDRYGVPLLDHVRRVVAAVPPEARTVAWLHEVLEFSDVTAGELRAAGATEDEVGAVRLLTRDPDGDAFEAHVARIAAAPGRSGELARIVKRADLEDRIRYQAELPPTALPRPPYLDALGALSVVGAQPVRR